MPRRTVCAALVGMVVGLILGAGGVWFWGRPIPQVTQVEAPVPAIRVETIGRPRGLESDEHESRGGLPQRRRFNGHDYWIIPLARAD